MERHRYTYPAPRVFARAVADEDIWSLWQARHDTYEIASILEVPEFQIANRLMHIREQKRREADWNRGWGP